MCRRRSAARPSRPEGCGRSATRTRSDCRGGRRRSSAAATRQRGGATFTRALRPFGRRSSWPSSGRGRRRRRRRRARRRRRRRPWRRRRRRRRRARSRRSRFRCGWSSTGSSPPSPGCAARGSRCPVLHPQTCRASVSFCGVAPKIHGPSQKGPLQGGRDLPFPISPSTSTVVLAVSRCPCRASSSG
uniref:Uncharacterized protein n=1 Tax=Emiliania huxleyi (strain CCMP1516) TaxID=280463 RepID=A0A0D3L1J5_EMIH1